MFPSHDRGETSKNYIPMNPKRKIFFISSDIPEKIITFNRNEMNMLTDESKSRWIKREEKRCSHMSKNQMNVWFL